jgi:tricorn protease interacting factor F2/3
LELEEYDLFIDLDFEQLRYEGQVLISLKTEKNVVLNSVGLDILRISSGETPLRYSQGEEEVTIETGGFNGTLKVEFSANIPDTLAGIYRAPYDKTHIVTTHFEAAQARRMFPCVDQPDAKAQFKLTVRVNRDLTAISNMPIESTKPDGEKKIVAFCRTPRMSTYLLYLGVGKFEEITAKLAGTEITVATIPGKSKHANFAQQEARRAIEYFNDYFAIRYALPKIHLIAVPEFAMGAMENWGAITFRETRLLADSSTSTRGRMQIALTIAHELAHQWFGDLVTMKWWDDIWLNESFATYMSYKALDSIHPEWRVWANFANGAPRSETLAGALSRDCLKNTHPIQVPVKSPDEIEQIFDAISYGKGAHVLQMIEAYVGEDAFREGVRSHLSNHSYSNASGDDFWLALERASGKPVAKIMSHWVHKPGYPIIKVSTRNGSLVLHQERFLLQGHAEDTTWPVPVIMEVNGDRKTTLLETAEEKMHAGRVTSLKVNPDRKCFYATQYMDLEVAAWVSDLSPFDRWGIAFDSFILLISGKIGFDQYLSTVERLENETDPLPIQEISDQLSTLWGLLPSKFANISKRLHQAMLASLDKNNDDSSAMLRGTVAARLAVLDNDFASKLAADFSHYGEVSPDMKGAVAISYATFTNNYDAILKAFRESASDEDKDRFLQAMAHFTKTGLLQRTLEFTMSGEVRRQDVIGVILATAGNPYCKDLTWNFIKAHIQKIEELYQSTGILSGALLSLIPILGIGRVEEFERFFADHEMRDAQVGVKAGIEKLKAYDRLVRSLTPE